MAMLKKIAAFAAAAAMTFSLAGCTDTSYVMTYGDEKINAGVYLYNMYNEMSSQIAMLYYMQGITDKYFDQEIEGKKFADYLNDKAMQATKEYAAVVSQFEELGLELTEDEIKEISDNARDLWQSSGELYEKEGISKDSAKLVMKAAKMREKIFDYYYAEGGTEEVTNADIESYLNENYIRYKTISISKSTNEDKAAAEEEDKESEALRDEYLAKAEGLSFEEFDSVIDEYNDYLAKKAEEESAGSSTDDTSSEIADESSAADSSSSEPEPVSAAEEATEAPEADLSSADSFSDDTVMSEGDFSDDSAVDFSDISDSSMAGSDDSAAEDISGDTADSAAEDPYVNETMFNYGGMDDETKDSNSGKLAEKVNSMTVGVATSYEDESSYYIVIKGDITERSAEYASKNKTNMVKEMKADDFQEKLDGWIEELGIKENKDAIKRYTPETMYERQQEYNKDNQK
ncbi:MAG: hypothetical protein J5994_04665 [Ruminococcus sp.]|nr:hypothetical protein [Ruminococcus sp.]